MRRSGLALLPLILACPAWAPGPGHTLHGQVIMGRLLDGESLIPIRYGVIHLLDLETEPLTLTVSDSAGDFVLTAPDSGRYLIRAEAFGYQALADGPVELGPADTLGVAFYVLPDPTLLDPLVIEARRQIFNLRRVGYYRRQRRLIGHFMNREEIEDYRPHNMSGLLLSVPGIILRPGPEGRLIPIFHRYMYPSTLGRAGSSCPPTYFLDGTPLFGAGTEIDYLVHPDNVEAIEAYQSRAEVPVEFRHYGAACGVILIWSRR